LVEGRAHLRPPFAFLPGVTTDRGSQGTRGRRDLRRAISRQAWLTQRAHNAVHRPAFILAVSLATFLTALLSMVAVPRAQEQAAAPIPTVPRPDTLTLFADVAMSRTRLMEADSALATARMESAAEVARREAESARALAADTLAELRRDSLAVRLRALELMIARTEQAPLASSYRALAELPDLRGDARVLALVDSLTEIERERDGIGAVGGVDPIFVALTSRANEIGRTIQALANERRQALVTEIERLENPAAQVVEAPQVDTLQFIASRDSARAILEQAGQELVRRRALARQLDAQERAARRRATEVAPTYALLAAAFVLAAVFGFGVAFASELRRPRVSTAGELERVLGIRVLSTIEPGKPDLDRRRREADRSAPSYLNPSAEGYQLAYLALATEHPAVLSVTVTGDDPAIAAVVAANLAAVSAEEARNTLVLDLDHDRRGSAALRVRAQPGISEIAREQATWPEALVEAPVGRHKTVDFIPLGSGAPPGAEQLAELLTRDGVRLARYYDAIVALAGIEDTAAGVPAALPSPEVIFCAQPGVTPMRELRTQLERIRASGGVIRGIVLWSAERPVLQRVDSSDTPPPAPRNRQPATVA